MQDQKKLHYNNKRRDESIMYGGNVLKKLKLAIKNCRSEMVERILRQEKINSNLLNTLTDEVGNSLLIQATIRNEIKAAIALARQPGIKLNVFNTNGDSALFVAIRNNNLELVRWLMEKGRVNPFESNLNGINVLDVTQQEKNTSILQYLQQATSQKIQKENVLDLNSLLNAVRVGNQVLIDECLISGVSINGIDKEGNTALHWAVWSKKRDMVRCLIEKGCKINVNNKNWKTPVDLAEELDDLEIYSDILKVQVQQINKSSSVVPTDLKNHSLNIDDVTAKNNEGLTALHQATKHGDINAVSILLQKQIDVNAQTDDENRCTSLHIAAQKGDHNIATMLIQAGAYVDACNGDGKTSLYLTAQNGEKEMTELLLRKGADLEIQPYGENDLTLLHQVAKQGYQEIVALLLNYGADVNECTPSGITLLHIAEQNRDRDMIQFLLQKGADPRTRVEKEKGFVLLHSACEHGYRELAAILIDDGVDVNRCDDNGWSPLRTATKNGHTEVMQLLLQRGANEISKSFSDQLKLVLAFQRDNLEVIALLLDCGISKTMMTNLLCWAASDGDKKMAELLLERGADVNLKRNTDKNGNSPLHIAAQRGFDEIVELLVNFDGDVNRINDNGFSPLHLAAIKGHTKVIQILLQRGAFVNLRDQSGKLSFSDSLGYQEIAPLSTHSWKIRQYRSKGATALYFAIQNNHREAVQLLLESGADVNAPTNNKDGNTPLQWVSQKGDQYVYRCWSGCLSKR